MNREQDMPKLTVAALAIITLNASFTLAATQQYLYGEITDSWPDTTQVTITADPAQTTVEVKYAAEAYHLSTDATLNTRQCVVTSNSGDHEIIFRRRGKMIVIRSGTVASVESVGDLPWYQSPFTLVEFITSGASKLKFLTATANTLATDDEDPGGILTMVAKKQGLEDVVLEGKAIPAERVIITLTGIKSFFWKITYWYRPADGVVLKYQEARGGPGTPDTYGILISEKILD